MVASTGGRGERARSRATRAARSASIASATRLPSRTSGWLMALSPVGPMGPGDDSRADRSEAHAHPGDRVVDGGERVHPVVVGPALQQPVAEVQLDAGAKAQDDLQ